MERWGKFTGFIINCVLFLADITFLTKYYCEKCWWLDRPNKRGETCQNSGFVETKE